MSESKCSGATARAYFVYMLRCSDQTLYTGLTCDLARRLAEHQAGGPRSARYTRARRSVSLVWQSQALPDRATAARLEAQLKALSRAEKLAWIAGQTQVCGEGAADS